jgi:hypothetical protein
LAREGENKNAEDSEGVGGHADQRHDSSALTIIVIIIMITGIQALSRD